MKNLTILGVRFFALYMLLQAFNSLAFIPSGFRYGDFDFGEVWFFFVTSGLQFMLSGALFFGSNRIAAFIIPKTPDTEELHLDDYEKLSAVFFSTVGLLIIYWSLVSFFSSIGAVINMNALYPDNPNMVTYRTTTMLFGGGIRLIFGIALFIGGKKLAKWWNDFRDWT